MDNKETRALLSVYRAGESSAEEARLLEARAQAEADPELARWWSEEQELDRLISAKLASTHLPAGLRERLASAKTESRPSALRSHWRRTALLAAASIVALAVLFSSWRGPFQPAASMADFRDEMVSFIKVAPNLELESSEFARLQHFLAQAKAPAQFSVPTPLQKFQPVGCRVLRFRARNVSLVCFQLGGGRLAHLFVTETKNLRASGSAAAPDFVAEKDWMTATWSQDGQTFLLTVQGDRAALEKFLGPS